MSDKVELLPCPFCGNPARLESNRDWHRIVVDHDERCAFLEPESVMVPATDDQLSMAITCWNRRTDLAQQPAPVAVPEGWRDVIENARESIGAGALQENANTERRYVEPYLDGIYDELEALEKEAAPAAPAPAPAPEPQEPAAWLVHGGRTWADRVYLSHPQATQAVETRRDGSQLTALYTTPPAAEQPKCITCRDSGIVGHSDVCPACADTWTPAAEQPYSTTSDRYRAELYDEVWEKARALGFGNVTMALADLEAVRRILTDDDMRRLRRFQEICEDSDADGHDLPKEAVKRLERAGALRSCGFGRHEVTAFGEYLLGKEGEA